MIKHPFFTGENLIKEKENEELDLEVLNYLLTLIKPTRKFHELINVYLCFHFIDKNEEKKLSGIFK